jgi:hypothetical protein
MLKSGPAYYLKRTQLIGLFLILILSCAVVFTTPASAVFKFGVGLNWVGNSGMGMGFDMGYGSEDLGVDFAHYGVQPTLYSFGTVALSHDRLGIYYKPFDLLMVQTGLHAVALSLSDSRKEVLGTREASNWNGYYLILSIPYQIEETYYIKPFWGILAVDNGSRNEIAFGISLGAEFDVQGKKVLF